MGKSRDYNSYSALWPMSYRGLMHRGQFTLLNMLLNDRTGSSIISLLYMKYFCLFKVW